jgi:prophage antirepressor-like protein
MLCVSEQGLYEIIFSSIKPEAIRFRAWVTGEVLPSIRKTGGYQIPRDEWRKITDSLNRNIDRFFIEHDGWKSDYRHLHEWKELMLEYAEEEKRQKWELHGKLAIVKGAYNDLLKNDFAANELLKQEEKRWKIPQRKGCPG